MNSINTKNPDWAARAHGYLSNGFKEIQGWSSSPFIYKIIDEAHRYQIENNIAGFVGEIGVHHGRLFLYLEQVRNILTEKAVAIDLFDDQKLNIDASGRGDINSFDYNLERFGYDVNTVIKIKGDSTSNELKKQLCSLNSLFRLFSIDGGHTVGHAMSDLFLAEKYIANGGLVLLDDVFTLEWSGVTEALYKYLLGSGTLVPVIATHPKIMLTTLSHAESMRQHFRTTLGSSHKLARTYISGHEVLILKK